MKLELNSKDFDKKFAKIVNKAVPEALEKGLARACFNLLRDCIMVIPTVPLKEGWLRGSGSIFVQNKLVGTSEGMPGAKAGKAEKKHSEEVGRNQTYGMVAFNTPYASRLHEGVDFQFTEPSSGAKFLEDKIKTRRQMYMKTIALAVQEAGK